VSRERIAAAAEAVGAHDVFVFRRVADDRFVHVGGLGRGEGWAGNIELVASEEPRAGDALRRARPVRFDAEETVSVLGPYYARSAVFAPVSHDVVVLFGRQDQPLRRGSEADVQAAAAAAAEGIEFVSPAKRLADELEVLHAVDALARTDARGLSDVMQHIVDVAAASLSCELGVLYLDEPDAVAVATRGWDLGAGEADVVRAVRSLRSRTSSSPVCIQDNAADPLPAPFDRSSGIRSYYLLPVGEPALGLLLLMHTDAVPRGFTTLCRQLGLRLVESAEGLLRGALLREHEEQAHRAQKLESLGVLAGGIAHDFNNLLVGILGNAELALRELPEGWPARERIVELERAAHRAAELSRQMLVYACGGTFVTEPIELSRAVEELGHLLEGAVAKNATLTYELTSGLRVRADASQLRQLVVALLTNASEALGEGTGALAMRTGCLEADRSRLASALLGEELPPGRYAYLEVSDDGCGMEPPVQARIFEPFFTTKFTGRGLGLPAVLGIVRAPRGAIEVESEPGGGTTVRVLLPLERAGEEPGTAPDAGDAAWRGEGVVLVADDEEFVRGVVASILERAGYTVVFAGDGEEALALLGARGNEVVAAVIDVTMPRLGGDEVLRRLRESGSRLPVVLSSGYYDAADRLAADAGVRFLEKPYRSAELLAHLRELTAAA
jgi:signal transduction histidine kinase